MNNKYILLSLHDYVYRYVKFWFKVILGGAEWRLYIYVTDKMELKMHTY